MRKVNELVNVVFSGLSPLVIEDVADEGERILVRARTPVDLVPCPDCGAPSRRVHGYHLRTPDAALAALPRERRAHLLTGRAIGEKQAGLRAEAVATLLKAEEEAPEEVLCRPRTKQQSVRGIVPCPKETFGHSPDNGARHGG